MTGIEAISTRIEKIIETEEGFLILEDYFGFQGISNLYLIDNKFKKIWFAEKLIENDRYRTLNKLNQHILESNTLNGCKVYIDSKSGKIIERRTRNRL